MEVSLNIFYKCWGKPQWGLFINVSFTCILHFKVQENADNADNSTILFANCFRIVAALSYY